MAQLEAKIILCKILQQYVIKPPPRPYVLKMEPGITSKPKDGMSLVFIKRKPKE